MAFRIPKWTAASGWWSRYDPPTNCAQREQRMLFLKQPVDSPPENTGAVRTGRWVVVGIVAILIVAMLAYDYTRPYSTMANVVPSSYPSTTGAVPASHNINPARNP